MLGEASENYLVQCYLAIQKQCLPVGRKMIIQKASEINRYMFGSMPSVVSVVLGWCD